jgi:hypothetical protein
MKKRKLQSNSSSSLMKDEARAVNALLSMDRTSRLLTMALSMPQVQNLFRKITKRKQVLCLHDKFDIWKYQTIAWTEEKRIKKHIQSLKAVIIQCCARKYLARKKTNLKRTERMIKVEKVRIVSCIKMQCMIRKYFARRKVALVREHKRKTNVNYCALRIQKVFRGYLGRGIIILMHRQKLIRLLRNWANGITMNLLHISGID